MSNLVIPDAVLIQCDVCSVTAAVEALIKAMCNQRDLPELESSLLDRVRQADFSERCLFASHTAIPHLRSERLDEQVLGVCIPASPFEEAGHNVSVVVLEMSSQQNLGLHMKLLRTLLEIFRDRGFEAKLLECVEPAQVCDLFRQLDLDMEAEILVEDLMKPSREIIGPDETLRTLAGIVDGTGQLFIPVVDHEGVMQGEVSVFEIIRLGLPNYSMMLNSPTFLNNFQPFEKFLREETQLRVKDVMVPISCCLKPGDTLSAAVFEMVRYRRREIPVLDGKRLVGILAAKDLFRKVARS